MKALLKVYLLLSMTSLCAVQSESSKAQEPKRGKTEEAQKNVAEKSYCLPETTCRLLNLFLGVWTTIGFVAIIHYCHSIYAAPKAIKVKQDAVDSILRDLHDSTQPKRASTGRGSRPTGDVWGNFNHQGPPVWLSCRSEEPGVFGPNPPLVPEVTPAPTLREGHMPDHVEELPGRTRMQGQ